VSDLLTLINDAIGAVEPGQPPAGYAVREFRSRDIDEVGSLYFASYDSGLASETLGEAMADIRDTFDGAYGELWDEASLVATHDGDIVAVLLTVRRTPWDDAPRCPFVVEIFTERGHRRRGLAMHLMERCLAEIAEDEEARALALRVRESNGSALELCRVLGFRRWGPAIEA
jgi:N-alpha-acetyltransferase 10/11